MKSAGVVLIFCCLVATSLSYAGQNRLTIKQQRFRDYYQQRGTFNFPPNIRQQPATQEPFIAYSRNQYNNQYFNQNPMPTQPKVQSSPNHPRFNMKPQVSNVRVSQPKFSSSYGRSQPVCGIYKPAIRNYVANGKSTQHFEWPWYVQVIIKTEVEAYCGGTLISTDYVLTAAHCFDDIPPERLARSTNVLLKGVRFFDSATNSYESVEAKAVSVTLNPDYVPTMSIEEGKRLGIEPGPRHDMALIRIAISRREIRDLIMPACLPANEFVLPIGAKCKIMGHGFTNAQSEDTFTMPKMLQMADVTISDNSMCRAEVDSEQIKSKITGDTLCVRGPIHPCVGDSGGPLVCKGLEPGRIMGDTVNDYDYGLHGDDDATGENEEWYLTGVTSFAVSTDMNDKCGLFKSAVFGRVSGQREWIRRMTGV